MTKPGRSSRKISSSRRLCGASIFRSDIARVVESAYRAAIPCRPPTRWAPHRYRSDRKAWQGWLHHDGWRPYYQFAKAFHQSCLNHLLTRCKDLIEKVSPSAAQFPSGVLELLRKGMDLRDRYTRQEISVHGLAVATGRIEAAMHLLLSKTYRTEANQRLAKHLCHEQRWLFSFLHS